MRDAPMSSKPYSDCTECIDSASHDVEEKDLHHSEHVGVETSVKSFEKETADTRTYTPANKPRLATLAHRSA